MNELQIFCSELDHRSLVYERVTGFNTPNLITGVQSVNELQFFSSELDHRSQVCERVSGFLL